jgi:hypothetical protein
VHDDPRDRPKDIFGGSNTLHFESGRQPYLLLSSDSTLGTFMSAYELPS